MEDEDGKKRLAFCIRQFYATSGPVRGEKLTALKLKDGGTTCPEDVTWMWPPRLLRMQAVDGLTAINYIPKVMDERYRR